MRRTLPTSAAGLALAVVLSIGMATPLWAAPDEGSDDVSAQVKKQMEKIIELMRENEKALLTLSTGGRADTTQPEVEGVVPPGSEGASSGSGGATRGSEIEKKLEEIVKAQRATAPRIPQGLEELVRMVPQ